MSLTSRVEVKVQSTLTGTQDLGSSKATMVKSYALNLADGTLAGQANRVWGDTRTLGPSASEDLDLAGALLDALGGPFVLTRVRALIVAAAPGPAQVNDVLVGGAAATQFLSWVGAATHQVRLRPGCAFALLDGQLDLTGYVVSGGTADLLRVTNGGAGTSVTYDIIVIGTS